MTIQDWGAVGEIVGGVGVIASLLYLAVQIRQNSRMARNATTQHILGQSAQMNIQVAGDVSDALAKSGAGSTLAPDEEFRVSSMFLAVFAAHWQVYYQHSKGMIEGEIVEAYERRTLFMLERPDIREWWRANAFRFSEDYQTYVDELLPRVAPGEAAPSG